MKWDGLGQPWQKGSPEGRLAKVQVEEPLELSPPPVFPPPPKPADELQEVAPEVKAHIESLQSGFHAQVGAGHHHCCTGQRQDPKGFKGKEPPKNLPQKSYPIHLLDRGLSFLVCPRGRGCRPVASSC